MQDASLADAQLDQVVFTEAFDAVHSIAVSPDGHDWAAGSNNGEIRIWREEGSRAYAVRSVPTYSTGPSSMGELSNCQPKRKHRSNLRV
jgi:WD40 repeat protein